MTLYEIGSKVVESIRSNPGYFADILAHGIDGDGPDAIATLMRKNLQAKTKNKLPQQTASAATGSPMPDPDDWDPEKHGWSKNQDGKWHHADSKKIKGIHNKPNVTNSRLQKLMDEMYRPSDKRPGGSASELRREVEYGLKDKHITKVEQRINGINRIIKEEKLSRSDLKTAERVLYDLKDALNLAKKGK